MNYTAFKQLTRFEQSFFGLPFVLAGVLLPFVTHTLGFHFQMSWLWILPAFISARISGMAFNQVIDRHIDAENPRTSSRVVASGIVHKSVAYLIAFLALLLFLFSAYQINIATFTFSLLAALLLASYSYMKRVTYFCHLVLGMVHFLGPLMAWLAIVGTVSLYPLFLAFANMSLLVGVDIIYALQDVEFDKEQGLCSVPVRFGVKGAQAIAQFFHLLCILSLLFLGVFCHFSLLYYLCPLIVGFVLLFFHLKADEQLLKSKNLKEFATLFFYCTLLTSCTTFLFVLLEWGH